MDDVYTFSISLPSSRYDFRAGDTGAFLERLEDEITALPGVVGAAPIWPGPLAQSRWGGDLDTPDGTTGRAEYSIASNAFFGLLDRPALVPALRDWVAALDSLVPLADPRPSATSPTTMLRAE